MCLPDYRVCLTLLLGPSWWDSLTFAEIRVSLPTLPRLPGGSPDPSRTYRWISRLFPVIRVGLPTTPGPPGWPPILPGPT